MELVDDCGRYNDVIAILFGVFGIGGAIICIYVKNRRPSNDPLVRENVAESTYGTC